jgi:outer membrane protein OmpA-like peptidoglycan-associated protein
MPTRGILFLGLMLAGAVSAPAAPYAKGGVLGVGAAEAGQAGAVVARSQDEDALYWNPAGLDAAPGFDLGVSYGDGLGGGLYDTAFAHRGVLPLIDAAYGIGARHEALAPALTQDEYLLGVAFPFTEDGRLLAGFTLQALQARVDAVSANGYGVDLGLRYRPPGFGERLTVGLAAQDLQAGLDWPAGPPDDPQQLFQAGAAWALGADSSVEFDGEAGSDPSDPRGVSGGFKVGAERWWGWPAFGLKRVLALRLGYLQNSSQAPASLGGEFSAGLGAAWNGWRLDASWTQGPPLLGPVQRVSLAYDLGRPQAAPSAAAPAPAPSKPVAPGLALAAEPDRFDPARDRGGLLIDVRAQGLAAAARSRVEITGPQGQGVAFRDLSGLAQSFAWDGKLAGAVLAPPGAYRVAMTVFDAQGVSLAAAAAGFQLLAEAGPLTLSPQQDQFAPLAQSSRPQALLAVGGGGGGARRWTLTVRPEKGGAPLRVLSGPGLPALLAWNGQDRAGRRAADGAYALTLQVLGADGATRTAQARVEVDTRRPQLSLEALPRVFKAGDGLAVVSFKPQLRGTAGIPVRWSLQMQALDGKALRSFAGAGSPPELVAWNGANEEGHPVAAGTLLYADYMVEMDSGAQARLPRLALATRPLEPSLPFRVPLKTLRFAAGDESVALEDFKALKDAAAAVKQYSADYAVQVLGHAAEGESGRDGLGELELSFLRARSVRDFLVDSEGLDPDRVQASGVGAEDKASGEGGERQRRVDVILYAK